METKMPTKREMERARRLLNTALNEVEGMERKGRMERDEDLWALIWSAWGPVCIYCAMPKSGYTDAEHARKSLDDALEAVDICAEALVDRCPEYRDAIMAELEVA